MALAEGHGGGSLQLATLCVCVYVCMCVCLYVHAQERGVYGRHVSVTNMTLYANTQLLKRTLSPASSLASCISSARSSGYCSVGRREGRRQCLFDVLW